jgi:hypothetical protein
VQFVKPSKAWDHKLEKQAGRERELSIRTTEYYGEKRPAKAGLYIIGQRLYPNLPRNKRSYVITKPFATDDLISLNLVNASNSPSAWIDFTNKFGMLGTEKERWFLSGRDPRVFVCDVEAEGSFHHLLNVLRRIYDYFPAIQSKNSNHLSRFIEWDSEGIPREKWGPKIGNTVLTPAIAMKGYTNAENEALKQMRPPDLVYPAAFSIQEHVNRYLKDALSLEIGFDSTENKFTSSLRYGSFGAALVAEAVDFMAGRFGAQQCKVCSSWFRIGREQKRRDRIFCSAACKMRDYRYRKSA